MFSLMSFSKHSDTDGCQRNGPPVIQACDFMFLWYGHNSGFFEACGNQRERERLKVSVKPPASWHVYARAHSLGCHPGQQSCEYLERRSEGRGGSLDRGRAAQTKGSDGVSVNNVSAFKNSVWFELRDGGTNV